MEVKEEDEPPIRIKTQETSDPEEKEEDRISLLPDCLIIDEILSRLESTKYAIRTGALSKRWLHLWTSVPCLFFADYHMKNYSPSDHSHVFEIKPLPGFYPSVDKALTQCRHRQLKNLNKFQVHANYDNGFESHVDNLIHFATSSNAQQLDLELRYKEDEDQFVLKDDSFFINSHFTHLDLAYCIFIPTGPISWNNLTHLTFSDGKLDQDLIANILSGSPLLDTLRLDYCYGYSLLDITSKSVKNLVFCGYSPQDDKFGNLNDIIEINAPYISSLTIMCDLLLWKILLRDVSSLVKANLDYTKLGHDETTRKEEREEMLKRFILSLRHVKELNIGIDCYTVLSRLAAKGFIFPPNLKVPDVTSPLYSDSDSMELGDCSDNDSSHNESSDNDSSHNESSDNDSSDSDASDSDSVESRDSEELVLDDGPEADEVN